MTRAQLKEILEYNPITGVFTWLKPRGRLQAGSVAGWTEQGRYTRINTRYGIYYAHRLAFFYITGRWPKADVDHVNGNKADNRWKNLRGATRTQNFFNRGITKRNLLGLKGVFKKRNKFIAAATKNKKTFYLGSFDTPEKAHKAYVAFARKNHGRFLHKGAKNVY